MEDDIDLLYGFMLRSHISVTVSGQLHDNQHKVYIDHRITVVHRVRENNGLGAKKPCPSNLSVLHETQK